MRDDRPTPPPIIGSEGAYEDLDGAQGREVYFRPTRYSQKDLGPVRATVEVTLHGHAHTCEMQDVSQNGVAFRWPASVPPPGLGEPVACLVVRFDLHDAYRGGALVMSVREQPGGYVVGASFTDALMDIGDVLHMRDVRSWSVETARQLSAKAQPWYVPGFETFKSLVGELKLFFDETAASLNDLEKRLPWHVVHGTAETPARAALLRQFEADFVPDYLRYSYAIDAASRNATPDEWAHLKEFSLRHVHGYLMQAPFVERAFTKPLGYPGDFELMRFLYGKTFEGQTLFAKALHYAVVHMSAGEAVRQRKDMIKRAMRSVVEGGKPGSTVRIASVAAGPAREVAELVHELTDCPANVEIVLFDQDRLALENAHSRIGRAASRWPQVKILYRHDSIKRLLQDPTMLQGMGPFDMLFCAGLFDYLRFSTATTLCRTFHTLLAPGGHAWVGNMVDNPCRWFMEMHCDWYLTYRTREEILAFGRAAAPDARIEIANEPTGVNPFLVMQKAAP